MKMKRETKIGITAAISALISLVAIALVILGAVTQRDGKFALLSILCLSMITFSYCLILDWHRPDPRWKVKLSGIFSCFTAVILLAGAYKNLSIDVIMRIFFFSFTIFVIYYAFLYVVEKVNNFKMKLLKLDQI